MPGTFGSGAGVGGDGARLMILLQLGLKMPVYRKWKRMLKVMSQLCLPGAGNPLAAALADEEAVAGAPHVLAPGRGVPDGRGLVAGVALHHMLQFRMH